LLAHPVIQAACTSVGKDMDNASIPVSIARRTETLRKEFFFILSSQKTDQFLSSRTHSKDRLFELPNRGEP
jgi:hypothetical protein